MRTDMLSLAHLVREPVVEPNGAPPLLLMLHGVGSNERALMGLAGELDDDFLVVGARGPVTFGPDAYGWFHVQFTSEGPIINTGEAEESRQTLVRFVDELVEFYGADPSRVYLMGFSQGTIVALSVALTRPDKVAGVVAQSGRILPEIRLLLAPPEALEGLQILLTHGTGDPKLSIRYARQSRQTLSALGIDLEYREYPMGHEISQRSLMDVAAWLGSRLHKEYKEEGGTQ